MSLASNEYILTLKGADIANAGNELETLIKFEAHKDGASFKLNGGQSLPGKISLFLKDPESKRANLYLRNAATGRYEKLDAKDEAILYLDTPGDYLLTNGLLGGPGISKVLLFGGGAAVILGLAVFVLLRRRYLFW